jgi:hypothetical protein
VIIALKTIAYNYKHGEGFRKLRDLKCAQDSSYFEPLLIHFNKLAKAYQALE